MDRTAPTIRNVAITSVQSSLNTNRNKSNKLNILNRHSGNTEIIKQFYIKIEGVNLCIWRRRIAVQNHSNDVNYSFAIETEFLPMIYHSLLHLLPITKNNVIKYIHIYVYTTYISRIFILMVLGNWCCHQKSREIEKKKKCLEKIKK